MSDEWWFRRGDERVVWRGRPRLSAALPGVGLGVAVCAVAVVAAAVVDPRLLAAGLPGVGIASWSLLRVRRTSYVVTTRAAWAKRGVLGREVRRVGVRNVQNTALAQSVTGSAFGYGTVTVEVAGGPDLRFRRVDDPEAVRAALAEGVTGDDEAVPGSPAQWRAVLRLVRDVRTAVERSA